MRMEMTIGVQAKERFAATTKFNDYFLIIHKPSFSKLTDFNPDFVRKVCGPLTKKLSE